MKKLFLFFISIILFCFTVSCDNGSSKKNVTDEDSILSDADSIIDSEPDEDDLDAEIIDSDGEIEDADQIVQNPCDPNPCNEANRSQCVPDENGGFTCLCDRLTCEIDGKCIKDGEVNSDSTCTYCNRDISKTSWSPRPENSECEAVSGVMGSGLCKNGSCNGFGECDNRPYGLKAGMPCNYNSECGTGFCDTIYDWSGTDENGMSAFTKASVCTGTCKEDEDCPGGMNCHYHSKEYGYQCRPLYVSMLKRPSPKMKTFQPCNLDDDCEGGLCLSYGGEARFCSEECTSNLISDSCGSCGKCKEGGTAGGFKFEKYCVHKGSVDTGGPCQSVMDCSSGACYDSYCTASCSSILTPCPSGFECMENVYQDGVKTCHDPNRFDMVNGEECSEDSQCASGNCIEFSDMKICGDYCTKKTENNVTTYLCEANTDMECGFVKASNNYACLPESVKGHLEFGEDCTASWQCGDGYECVDGLFCSKACETDGECAIGSCYIYGSHEVENEDGTTETKDLGLCVAEEQKHFKPGENCPYVWSCEDICYGDETIKDYYCTVNCESDADCFDIGGCFDGVCRKAYPWRQSFYNVCRFDDDCEKNAQCLYGVCSTECSGDSGCIGYDAVDPAENQKTCNSCEVKTDCQVVFYDYGSCVIGYEGEQFCLQDCQDNPALCPEGTYCNGQVCYPFGSSCGSERAFCNRNSICAVPTVRDYWACAENRECFSKDCGSNLCQPEYCVTNADCNCDMMRCVSGDCIPDSRKGTLEIEPNNTLETAQLVTEGFIFGTFYHESKLGYGDNDFYKFEVKAGKYLNIRTRPFCGEKSNATYVVIYNSNGDVIANSNDQQTYFSEFVEYHSDVDSFIYVQVFQHPYVTPLMNSPYTLEFNMFEPDENNSCEKAETLTAGTYDRSIKNGTDQNGSTTCSGGYSYGPDLYYKVSVPAKSAMVFKVTPKSGEEGNFDAELSVLSDCSSESTCLAGNAFHGAGAMEQVYYLNNSDASKDVIVLLDMSYYPLEYDFTIDLSFENVSLTVPENDKIPGAVTLQESGVITGYTTLAENDYNPSEGVCQGAGLVGPDVVYSIEMEENTSLNLKVNAEFPLVAIIVKDSALNNCITGGYDITFEVTTAENAGKYYIILDSFAGVSYGNFSFEYEKTIITPEVTKKSEKVAPINIQDLNNKVKPVKD